MPGNPDPIEQVTGLGSGGTSMADVSKSEFVAHDKGNLHDFRNNEEVRGYDLSSRWVISINGILYVRNTSSTAEDDDYTYIVDAAGNVWVRTDVSDPRGADIGVKTAVDLVSTSNITLSGTQTIDGISSDGKRILASAQTTGSEKGIYIGNSSGAWLRAADLSASEMFGTGMLVYVIGGTSHAGSIWRFDTATPITLDTTSLTFTEIVTKQGAALLDDATAQAQRSTIGLVTSTTDNAIVRFDGTTGATQNSVVTISDAGSMSLPSVNAGIDIGSKSSSGVAYTDYNSSGNNYDHDVRFYVSGGSTSAGNGNATIYAKQVAITNISGSGTALSGVPDISSTFAGGSLNTQVHLNATAAAASTPEAVIRFGLTTSVGYNASPHTYYKIGLAGAVHANSGSASVWGANISSYVDTGAGTIGNIGIEVNPGNNNQNYTSDPGASGVYAVGYFVTAPYLGYTNHAAYLAESDGNLYYDGYRVQRDCVVNHAFIDASDASVAFRAFTGTVNGVSVGTRDKGIVIDACGTSSFEAPGITIDNDGDVSAKSLNAIAANGVSLGGTKTFYSNGTFVTISDTAGVIGAVLISTSATWITNDTINLRKRDETVTFASVNATKFALGVPLGFKVYTVATAPTPTQGLGCYLSDMRMFNGAGTQEGAGAGTGGLATATASAWKVAGTNSTAVA